MIWRIADAVDKAHDDRQAAEVTKIVASARRHYDREQLALLHDTAAVTLLMVGQGAAVSRERLTAQAKRDLELLENRQWLSPSARMNIVPALRETCAHLDTPVRFTGLDALWLERHLGSAVISAAREVTNNVDRHARASLITIDVQPDRVVISDDGIGFAPATAHTGHGIRASIARRRNCGRTFVARSAQHAHHRCFGPRS
jgi:hypothetical protein